MGLNYANLTAFRFITGIGLGVCKVTKPLFISELAPPSRRGFMVATFVLAWSMGLWLTNVIEAALPPHSSSPGAGFFATQGWRVELCISIFPATALLLLVSMVLPESPVYLRLEERKSREDAGTGQGNDHEQHQGLLEDYEQDQEDADFERRVAWHGAMLVVIMSTGYAWYLPILTFGLDIMQRVGPDWCS